VLRCLHGVSGVGGNGGGQFWSSRRMLMRSVAAEFRVLIVGSVLGGVGGAVVVMMIVDGDDAWCESWRVVNPRDRPISPEPTQPSLHM
jgi:hypothetical protein